MSLGLARAATCAGFLESLDLSREGPLLLDVHVSMETIAQAEAGRSRDIVRLLVIGPGVLGLDNVRHRLRRPPLKLKSRFGSARLGVPMVLLR